MTGNPGALSEREKETLRLLLQGHGAKSIAGHLGLSVHTVNERLRTARRKLEVPSSRDAARLLAQSEQRTPDFVVDKQIGVAGDAVDVSNGLHGRKGVEHPIVLAVGGTLIMSLIIAAAIFTWVAFPDREPGPLLNWSIAKAAPSAGARVTNSVRLDGNHLLWNGEPVPEKTIGQYLDIITVMKPQPMVILSYSAQTPPEDVQRLRLLIDDAVRCTPDLCLEITLTPA